MKLHCSEEQGGDSPGNYRSEYISVYSWNSLSRDENWHNEIMVKRH